MGEAQAGMFTFLLTASRATVSSVLEQLKMCATATGYKACEWKAAYAAGLGGGDFFMPKQTANFKPPGIQSNGFQGPMGMYTDLNNSGWALPGSLNKRQQI